MKKILVVVGPTASGKSALAVKLAKELNGEVISADSRQVYKGLNIGTGKITKKEMQGVRHHLLSVAPHKKIFSAADFVRLGRNAIEEIHARSKLPIVCGGTGFYIDALLGNVALADVPSNKSLREKLKNKSAAQLFAMLQKKDVERAERMNESDSRNPVRLMRALEIVAQQSHKMPSVQPATKYDATWIGIMPDTHVLQEKIHARLLARVKTGMIAEAKRLHDTGLSWKRMEELGLEYRYLARYLQKRISKQEMLLELENKIVQYSKRQITYWKRNSKIRWFKNAEDAYKFARQHYE